MGFPESLLGDKEQLIWSGQSDLKTIRSLGLRHASVICIVLVLLASSQYPSDHAAGRDFMVGGLLLSAGIFGLALWRPLDFSAWYAITTERIVETFFDEVNWVVIDSALPEVEAVRIEPRSRTVGTIVFVLRSRGVQKSLKFKWISDPEDVVRIFTEASATAKSMNGPRRLRRKGWR